MNSEVGKEMIGCGQVYGLCIGKEMSELCGGIGNFWPLSFYGCCTKAAVQMGLKEFRSI